ncbi:hypothetical protein S245_018784 [Arachis hypogaea]
MINSLDMGGSYFNPQKPCQKTGHKALNRLESLGLTEPGPEDQNPFKRNSLCSSEELLPSRRRSSTSPATAAVRTSPRVVATPLFVALPRLFAELPLCFAVLLPPFHRASAALQPSSSSLGSSESVLLPPPTPTPSFFFEEKPYNWAGPLKICFRSP